MRLFAGQVAIICLAVGAGCATVPPQPPSVDSSGVMHYSTDRTNQHIVCGDHPIRLEGAHTDMTLTGGCRFVTVVGSHNDITVDVVPGGTIDITGSHNDVNWRQTAPGPGPVLQDHGDANAYHQA